MGLTIIQWAIYTFNAWMGCRKVAEECGNCYITGTVPLRTRGIVHGAQRVRTSASTWKQPLTWNRKAEREGTRPRVFCLSLGDWLDDEVPIDWFIDLLALIDATPHLDWLLLTKRPQNFEPRMRQVQSALDLCGGWVDGFAPPNVWIGVSAGADQAAALAIPAKIHFLSCEPMLRPLDTTHAAKFDWIIFGGESGKKARQCDQDWIREGVQFCREHGVAPFVKQMGSASRWSGVAESFRFKDSHGGDWEEWPEDLRVREFPANSTLGHS